MTQTDRHNLLRAIPKVDVFLSWVAGVAAPERVIKAVVREILATVRESIQDGRITEVAELAREPLLAGFEKRLAARLTPNYRPLINATGVVVHTNLGRSLLPECAMAAIHDAGVGYGNLEFNLATGKRGSRYSLVEDLLCELTGAEAALVVNNNAAAVLLVLESLARGREVIVSRGQLVEIGGSFRIPEVMEKSGARLVEVGATNRTHLRDYQRAITPDTALLLKVHTSNYRMIGFTSEVGVADLAELAASHGLPVMEDLGSGSLIDLSCYGFSGEPTVSEVLRQGADVVTFSGDKMLGGPQAGIIVGRRAIIDTVKKNPLNRALRIDKFTLAGLESVLRLYLAGEDTAVRTIPTLAMLTEPAEAIGRRANRLLRRLKQELAAVCRAEKVAVQSRVGGGALPEHPLMSWAVALSPRTMTVNELEAALRRAALPVIGRIEQDRLLLDLRTVADHEVKSLAQTLRRVLLPDAARSPESRSGMTI